MKLVCTTVDLIGLMQPTDFDLLGTEPEKLIEVAGRVCYKSEDLVTDDSHKKFIADVCGKRHHDSIMEHSGASFKIRCDIGAGREAFRHRIASIDDDSDGIEAPFHPSPSAFSQESTRYCNYSKNKFGGELALDPMNENLTEAQIARRISLWEMIEEVYLAELAEGIKPQQARDNLPMCLKTEFVMTANFREWRHFLKLRLSSAAHPKIIEIAEQVRDILLRVAPTVFAEFAPDVTEPTKSCTTPQPSP